MTPVIADGSTLVIAVACHRRRLSSPPLRLTADCWLVTVNGSNYSIFGGSISAPLLIRNSDDVGWDYGVIVDLSNKDRLRCLLCGLQYTGGVSRIKRHIAQIRGDVASCTKASKEDILKCKKAIDDNAAKKKNKKKAAMDIREEMNIVNEGDESEKVMKLKM
ncbi:hypothetical protein RHGRI_026395 [Rhododendron griersonianum]|uniref:BED-type domain-containing protein n=1 Tax=Rhododendron griersonianum TaxID=479676 RepID=A0AAV6ITL0_9ERIC|nr:hypothetical protein RHGRI_026395 [Rhododendron griersonianum]